MHNGTPITSASYGSIIPPPTMRPQLTLRSASHCSLSGGPSPRRFSRGNATQMFSRVQTPFVGFTRKRTRLFQSHTTRESLGPSLPRLRKASVQKVLSGSYVYFSVRVPRSILVRRAFRRMLGGCWPDSRLSLLCSSPSRSFPLAPLTTSSVVHLSTDRHFRA